MTKISIILPAYNAQKYIAEALESMFNQTYADFECIVIDDGSTDNTLSILKSYNDKRLKIISRENRGLVATLNEGIKLAKGKYIARMDADDIMKPERLQKQFEFMEKNPDCVVVGCQFDCINENGKYLYSKNPPLNDNGKKRLGISLNYIAHPTMMIRTANLKKIGGYREELMYAEDRDLLYRLSNYGSLNNIQENLFQYRVINNSLSNNIFNLWKITYRHTLAYILHKKNGINNTDVNFKNWNVGDYIHLYIISILYTTARFFKRIVGR